jgi:hypothetical protein
MFKITKNYTPVLVFCLFKWYPPPYWRFALSFLAEKAELV